ncbi:MAG: photosynthetic complex assembly protein PuhC [Pseudomonadota bacterium]
MSHRHDVPIPTAMLRAAGALVVAALLGVTFVSATGIGRQDSAPTAPLAASRTLAFEDLPTGEVAIRDVASGQLVETLAVGDGGFLRATLRGLARRSAETGDRSFRIERRADGQLLLIDPRGGAVVDLWAFGPDNAAVFARYLESDAAPVLSAAQESSP